MLAPTGMRLCRLLKKKRKKRKEAKVVGGASQPTTAEVACLGEQHSYTCERTRQAPALRLSGRPAG